MYLPENLDIDNNIERIVNNAFHSNHPFQNGSGQLADFISIFNDIKLLPDETFIIVLSTLEEILENNENCIGCYGKGLAFIKLLCKDKNIELYNKFSEQYSNFANARNWDTDFEAVIKDKLSI